MDGTGVYLTGYTTSSDFPTSGPYQGGHRLGLNWDGFVTKLRLDGTALVYSTYLGGALDDEPHAVAVDSAGNAYITGQTNSPDFPIQPNYGD